MHRSAGLAALFTAVILCASLGLAADAGNKTIVLQPGPEEGKDAYVCECSPDANSPNGSQGILYQGQYLPTCYDRLLIQFDLASLPKEIKKIVSAKMELCCGNEFGGKEGKLAYYRILEPWDEDKVTFNTQPKYTEEGGVLVAFPEMMTWLSVDITAFVAGWYAGKYPNYGVYGFCKKKTDARCVVSFIPSDDASAKLRPKLTIVYQ